MISKHFKALHKTGLGSSTKNNYLSILLTVYIFEKEKHILLTLRILIVEILECFRIIY